MIYNSQALEDVEGEVRNIVYYDEETHFCIATFKPKVGSPITVKGTLVRAQKGELMRLSGSWISDARFGKQFKIKYFQMIKPDSLIGIRKYLGSGLIPGIGAVYAEKLVNHFGMETLDVIENQPDRLGEIDGLGVKRVASIIEAWREQKIIRDVMIFLRSYGLTESIAIKVFDRYGYKSMEEIQKDPYRLSRDITGVGFMTADRMARQMEIPYQSATRCRAGIRHILLEGHSEGHCYLPKEELIIRAVDLLQVELEIIESQLRLAVEEQEFSSYDDAIYIPWIMDQEDRVAVRLATLVKTEHKVFKQLSDKQFQSLVPDFALSDEQLQAINAAMASKVSIITGGPGVGKTTVLSTLVSLYEEQGRIVTLCSPTGKAARRMEEATGHSASTIHKLLKYRGGGFEHDENEPVQGDVFILDECSMIDISLFNAFLSALPLEAVLVMVGDVDQLPSVGPGCVLLDLISSNEIPVTRLKEIFRQEKSSDIVTSAHAVNQGSWFPSNVGQDFFFIPSKKSENLQSTLRRLLLERIPQKFDFNPILDVQILAPMYRGESGIDRFNELLQDWLNPDQDDLNAYGRSFRVGDRVMQLNNDYEKEVFNGDQGIVDRIDFNNGGIEVRFEEGRRVVYKKKELVDLTLSYCTSIHKVQGSEFPCVIVILSKAHFNMLKRNLLYTAITRGKKLVICLGDPVAFNMAINNLEGKKRYTRLSQRLNHWSNYDPFNHNELQSEEELREAWPLELELQD